MKSKLWRNMAASNAQLPGDEAPAIDEIGDALLALYRAATAEFPMNRVPEPVAMAAHLLVERAKALEEAAVTFCEAVAAALAANEEPADMEDVRAPEDELADIARRSSHRPER